MAWVAYSPNDQMRTRFQRIPYPYITIQSHQYITTRISNHLPASSIPSFSSSVVLHRTILYRLFHLSFSTSSLHAPCSTSPYSNLQPQTPLLMTPRRPRNPQHEIHHNSRQQSNSQNRRPKPIIETTLAPHTNTLGAPMVRHERIHHRGHCDESEETGRYLADAVAEVQEADGQAAEDDGEV